MRTEVPVLTLTSIFMFAYAEMASLESGVQKVRMIITCC